MQVRLHTLIIDGRHLLWRAMSTNAGLSAPVGDTAVMDITGVYVFLRTLITVHKEFGGVVIVAWDNKFGPQDRKAIFSEYKAGRGDRPTDLLSSISRQEDMLQQQLLPLCGVKQVQAPRWEADDAIATLCENNKGPNLFGALSGDRDLLGIVDDFNHLIRPVKRGFSVESTATCLTEMGVPPAAITSLKALAGDAGDNIPGVPGVGLKTAAKLLNDPECCPPGGDWVDVLLWADDNAAVNKLAKKISDHKKSVAMSAKLAKLNKSADLTWRQAKLDKKKLKETLFGLKMNSLLTEGNWSTLISMGETEDGATQMYG